MTWSTLLLLSGAVFGMTLFRHFAKNWPLDRLVEDEPGSIHLGIDSHQVTTRASLEGDRSM